MSASLHQSYALSFYRSQNVLGWSKFFVRDQKFIYILWWSQTFCARQKDDLHSVKLVLVPAQKFLKRHLMQSNFWAGSKNLDLQKHFGICKRTRHKPSLVRRTDIGKFY